ncbi:MAG: hypothetical protein M1826_001734 [Phylliscum demangeonii]|nr:MAG: hypothetical protein M1826_001734 [Phylliscum demangeonii]
MALANVPSSAREVLYAVGVMAAISLVAFLVKLYRARRMFTRLKRQGLSMPPHHPIFGHILLLARILARLPADAHPHLLADQIRRRYPSLDSIFYVDVWPFGPPILFLLSPDTALQCLHEQRLPKGANFRHFLRPLADGQDLVCLEGGAWRRWRTIFNPGFSAAHLMTLVPSMLDDVLVFRDILREHARTGDIFSLDVAASRVTMDIIGKVALNARFNTQRGSNPMTDALRSQIRWLTTGVEPNPLVRLNPLRPLVYWYNSRIMNGYLSRELEARYADRRQDAPGSKAIIDLALTSYEAEQAANAAADEDADTTTDTDAGAVPGAGTGTGTGTGKGASASRGMDATFKASAISQMKIFLFAGHDTTASTICYVYHLLSQHADALRRVRHEHHAILGPGVRQRAQRIASQPHLLHQLPYTQAVIKETLRLYPPASAMREGLPHVVLTGPDGRSYPTEHCIVWPNHQTLHRNPRYWVQADAFRPERWLVPADHELHPAPHAWRAFELGPRACIGQELALLELRMVMALTLPDLDVRAAYAEADADADAAPEADRRWLVRAWWWPTTTTTTTWKPKTPPAVNGERAYQILHGSAHPADGFPCRVR